ncbi:uncharacterized protein LOC114445168 [Parambassis ranga]|uniref:Uncharacterized protein LOC114445168 n=1 Tax=Parambassis ranga TaxID=210632 RepID=A0A6P7JGS5_9TELE|nr:uncharacterized protein LOC114445168 [Parambassis ranga]
MHLNSCTLSLRLRKAARRRSVYIRTGQRGGHGGTQPSSALLGRRNSDYMKMLPVRTEAAFCGRGCKVSRLSSKAGRLLTEVQRLDYSPADVPSVLLMSPVSRCSIRRVSAKKLKSAEVKRCVNGPAANTEGSDVAGEENHAERMGADLMEQLDGGFFWCLRARKKRKRLQLRFGSDGVNSRKRVQTRRFSKSRMSQRTLTQEWTVSLQKTKKNSCCVPIMVTVPGSDSRTGRNPARLWSRW